MRKVFCDRCGGECGSRIIVVNVQVIHQTNKAEPVGEDGYKPFELCGTCADSTVLAILPDMSAWRYQAEFPPDYAMAMPAPPPLAVTE